MNISVEFVLIDPIRRRANYIFDPVIITGRGRFHTTIGPQDGSCTISICSISKLIGPLTRFHNSPPRVCARGRFTYDRTESALWFFFSPIYFGVLYYAGKFFGKPLNYHFYYYHYNHCYYYYYRHYRCYWPNANA